MNYGEQRREEYYIQGGVRGKHRYVIKIGSTNQRNRIIHGVGHVGKFNVHVDIKVILEWISRQKNYIVRPGKLLFDRKNIIRLFERKTLEI